MSEPNWKKRRREAMEINELKTAVKEATKIDENDRRTNEIDYYTDTQAIRINTQDVQSLKTREQKLYNLTQQGIRINLRGPEFFVSQLDEVKLQRETGHAGFRQTGSHSDHQKESQRNR